MIISGGLLTFKLLIAKHFIEGVLRLPATDSVYLHASIWYYVDLIVPVCITSSMVYIYKSYYTPKPLPDIEASTIIKDAGPLYLTVEIRFESARLCTCVA